MEPAKLVLYTAAAVCAAAALLGEVAAFVCPEAFTIGCPPVFGDLPAPALGPLWAVMYFLVPAVMIGIGVTMAANFGTRPAVKAFFFYKPLAALAVFTLLGALVAAGLGYFATARGHWEIVGAMRDAVPAVRHPLLGAVWWGTLGAIAAAATAGIALAIWTWRKRAYFETLVNRR